MPTLKPLDESCPIHQQKKMLSSDILGEASFAQNLGLNDFEFLLGMERSLAEPSVVDEDD
jgi:hypothetical protein